ncbi:MAG: TetR/AcrR family transcriptional regulator [bacterium]|nr:TetR/AcrR family transcriptional regulator [bacterium]
MSPTIDRPAAIRRGLRDLVAERGFHGASMGAVAKAAGVATGTAYVHYESKEELVYATYLELKSELSTAVLEDFDQSAEPYERWHHLLTRSYDFLSEEPERARFLTQLEESPYFEEAHSRLAAAGDRLAEIGKSEELTELLVPLPYEVIYTLSFGVAVRLIAAGVLLKPEEIDLLVGATWRAVTKPQ